MDRKSKNTLIVSIIALALVLIGVTYAYFSARITGLESASTLSLTAGRMGIVYSEGDENVSVSNIYPREEAWLTKTFTLTGWNTTDQPMKYNVGLNVETNTFPNGYLTYDLKVLQSTNGTPVSEKTGAPINGSGNISFGKGTFTNADGDVHRYELKFYFKDNGLDQNDAQGAVFNAKINISEFATRTATVYNIESYTINKAKCLTYAQDKFDSEEDKQNYCNGKPAGGTPINISDDVRDYGDELTELGIIENVVKDENDNITSYTINKANCLEEIPFEVSDEEKDKYCSGEDILIDTTSIENDVADGYGGELKAAGVIENISGSPVELTDGVEYVDGQYTYTYSSSLDGWSVILTDKNSTDPVTTRLLTSINDKPIKSMEYMFYNSKATSIDLSSFDTSNVINMRNMFGNANVTTADLSSLDTSNVTTMSGMFSGTNGDEINLSNWDTSNVTDMGSMFEGSKFNYISLNSLNTSNVTDMSFMFNYSEASSIDLGGLDTENVTNMSYMFAGSHVTSLDLSSFDTSNVADMRAMFANSAATSIALSSFDTSNVTDMQSMFSNSSATSLDLSSFDTSKVTKMTSMFSKSKVTTLDLTSFNTTNVTDMGSMFSKSEASSLHLNSFDTSNVTRMGNMFEGMTNITVLDLGSFDTKSVTYFSAMFKDCINLKTIYTSAAFENSARIKPSTSGTIITNMFLNDTNLVGGNGTTYNSNYVDNKYAHIDGKQDSYYNYRGNSYNGYFTDVKDKPSS